MFSGDVLSQADFRHVDLQRPELTALFAQAPLYVERGYVQSYVLEGRVVVEKHLQDGVLHSAISLPEKGSRMVVTTNGERRAMPTKMFARHYSPTGEPGIYVIYKRVVRAFLNPTVDWVAGVDAAGESIIGDPDSMFAMEVDPRKVNQPTTVRYFINGSDFNDTHAPYGQVFGESRQHWQIAARISQHLPRWLALFGGDGPIDKR